MKTKPQTNKVEKLVTMGNDYIIRGQYEEACDFYHQALENNTDHYLIRNALGEAYFIRKEFLSAADNFWLAALNAAEDINIDLIYKTKPKLHIREYLRKNKRQSLRHKS